MTVEEVVKALEEKLATKGFANQTDVEAIKASIEELKSANDVTAIKEAITNVETQIEALKQANNEPQKEVKSFREALMSAFEAKAEDINNAINTKGANVDIQVKAAVNVTEANTILGGDSASHWLLTSFTGVISAVRSRVSRYLGLVSVGTINNRVAMWVEEYNEQGTPIFIGEGTGKTNVSVQYKEKEAKVQKIAVYCKVSTEMLRDLPQLVSYLQANLLRRIEVATVTELFAGNGTMLNGLLGYATAFTGGGVTTAIPSDFDVFRALALQVQKGFGTASAVFVNPDILAAMDMEKSVDGIYLIPPFKSADGTEVAGMQLIPELALIGSGVDFVGGDLSVVNVRFREGLSINIGEDGNDFTNNMRTILAEQALVQFVSANDTQVLVKGTMAAAKTLITAP
jgi:HK97 family phage major capsid protein